MPNAPCLIAYALGLGALRSRLAVHSRSGCMLQVSGSSPRNLAPIAATEPHCRQKLSEFAILCTARLWRAQYEWYAHAPMAEKGGVKPKTIDDLRRGRPPKSAPKDERAIFDFIQELYKTKRVSDRNYKRVQSLLGDTAIVELVGILGYYSLISMTLNVFRMLPPGSEKLAFPE